MGLTQTPSLPFGTLPPKSAAITYDTEGILFISAHLSTDLVSALRKVWVLLLRHVVPVVGDVYLNSCFWSVGQFRHLRAPRLKV